MKTNQSNDANDHLYVAAVSGGVDSVVLLHKLCQQGGVVAVAHVDHGIRVDSGDDLLFVQRLAESYGLPFRSVQLNLGPDASEELARIQRYKFLFKVAQEFDAKLATGHHADDVIETVAINLKRSTGWRGLSGLSDSRIFRPLTGLYKEEIYNYAKTNDLEWREDSTNSDRKYLRNDIRQELDDVSNDSKQQVLALWRTQIELRARLESEASRLVTTERYWYVMASDDTAVEVLYELLASYRLSLTRPQTMALLISIKVAKPGSRYSLAKGWEVLFTNSTFTIQSVK